MRLSNTVVVTVCVLSNFRSVDYEQELLFGATFFPKTSFSDISISFCVSEIGRYPPARSVGFWDFRMVMMTNFQRIN